MARFVSYTTAHGAVIVPMYRVQSIRFYKGFIWLYWTEHKDNHVTKISPLNAPQTAGELASKLKSERVVHLGDVDASA